MNLPRWYRQSSKKLCETRVFSVRADTVVRARGGRAHEVYVIDCPDWVNVLPITEGGDLLLVRQHRFGIDAPSLEIPGGVVDPGESPLEAAGRELLEETGYRAGRIELLGTIHPNPALQPNRAHSFLATGCTWAGGAHHPDSTEELELVRVPLDQADELLRTGEISHALVAVAFLHWKLRGSPGRP